MGQGLQEQMKRVQRVGDLTGDWAAVMISSLAMGSCLWQSQFLNGPSGMRGCSKRMSRNTGQKRAQSIYGILSC